jgi:hypothetical protein
VFTPRAGPHRRGVSAVTDREDEPMSTRKELQAAWHQVCKDFFPRWHHGQFWRVKIDGTCPAHGQCEPRKRLVTVQYVSEESDQRDLLLIHEICHAVAGQGHKLRWQRRLEQAAARAGELGRDQLQALLVEELRVYRAGLKVTAAMIYGDIQDAVAFAENKIPSYAALRALTACQYDMRPRELEKKYPRCRRVYDAAVRTRWQYDQVQRRLQAAP